MDKDWAAIEDEETVQKEHTKEQLHKELLGQGLDPDDYEIVAVPRPYISLHI